MGDESDPANPYAPPASKGRVPRSPAGQAHLQGALLVVSKTASLPGVCLKCAGPPDLRRRHVFQFTPPWVYALLPFCGLIALVLMFALRKTAALEVPLCNLCNERWRSGTLAFVIATVALFLSVLAFRAEGLRTGVVVFGVALAAFLGVLLAFVRPRVIRAVAIDDATLTLRGVSPAAAEAVVKALG